MIKYFFFLKCFLVSTFLALSLGVQAGAYEDFFKALDADDSQKVAVFLNKGFDINALDNAGTPVIVRAVQKNALQVLRVIVELPGIDIEQPDRQGDTALLLAALVGKNEFVGCLLAAGAQVNRAGWNALHYAATNAHVETMRLLLEANAYIDAFSSNKTTPLMLAARANADSAVAFLLAQGADPTLVSEAGFNAAGYAMKAGNAKLGERLLLAARDFKNKYYRFPTSVSGDARRE
ncbi:MAG: ankyrin repeat domain-containing protein [Burkholderiaceae bacterium]|jgi:ankyrin repeat protein